MKSHLCNVYMLQSCFVGKIKCKFLLNCCHFHVGIPGYACGAEKFSIINSWTSILISETFVCLLSRTVGSYKDLFVSERKKEWDLKPAMKMSASITRAAWTCLALPYFNFNDSHSVDQWGVPSENDTSRDLPLKSPGDPYQGDAQHPWRRTHTRTRYRVMSNEQEPWIKPEMREWSGEEGVSNTPTPSLHHSKHRQALTSLTHILPTQNNS